MERWWWRGWPAVFGAAAGVVVWLVTRRALPDDAFITLDYARNLVEHARWGLLATRTSNTATSPANVWLLAIGIWVTRRPIVAVGLVLVIALALVGWWADGARRELRLSPVLSPLVVVLLACSPLLVSTVGLETYLACALLLGVARYALAGRRIACGVAVGAAVLVRPDLVVPALVLGTLLVSREGTTGAVNWRPVIVALGMAAAVALPWHVFAWTQLGGFLPDTAWFKSGDVWSVRGRDYHFATGWLLYGQDFTKATVLTLAPAAAGLGAAAVGVLTRRREPARRAAVTFAAAGLTHWAAIAALRTAPYAWYLAPSLVCLTVTACLATSWAPPTSTRWRIALAGHAALVAATVGFLASWGWSVGPINYNWGSARDYARVGSDLAARTRGAPIAASWEIGTTEYFCRCELLDWFGDRAQTDELIHHRLAGAGPITRALARWNFAYRPWTPPTPPSWYLGPGQLPNAVVTWPVSTPAKGTQWGSLIDLQQPINQSR